MSHVKDHHLVVLDHPRHYAHFASRLHAPGPTESTAFGPHLHPNAAMPLGIGFQPPHYLLGPVGQALTAPRPQIRPLLESADGHYHAHRSARSP